MDASSQGISSSLACYNTWECKWERPHTPPIAGGKGIKVQFTTIGAAVEVLKRRRDLMAKSNIRVEEDLPLHLQKQRTKNRPIFRHLLEVRQEQNTWYRMRGGKIQINNTFRQETDGQGQTVLMERGEWRDFDAETYAETTKQSGDMDITTWWQTRTARLMAQRAAQNAPATPSGHEA